MINLYHLRYFLDAVRLGGVSPAARKNSLTQSAVSQAIRSLEKQVGVPLVLHQRNRFQLTEAGVDLARSGKKLLNFSIDVQDRVAKTEPVIRGELRIGATTTLAMTLLPKKVARFRQLYPGVTLQIRIGNSEVIQAWLKKGSVHIGFMADDGKGLKHLKRTKIEESRFVLFIRRRNPTRMKLGVPSLIVSRKGRSEVRKLRSLYKKKYKRELGIGLEIISWEVIKSFVKAGLGVGFVPEYFLREELCSGELRELKGIGQSIPCDILAVSSRQRPLSNLAEEFLKIAKGEAAI